MKTIAQQLNVKDFPFEIRDKNGKQIYWEDSKGFWVKREFDSNGNEIYFEISNGFWVRREWDSNGKQNLSRKPKGSCSRHPSKTKL